MDTKGSTQPIKNQTQNRRPRLFIIFKGKECEKRFYNGRGYMVKFPFDQYELKIYDKGHQFNLSQSVLRFEIKVTTMNFLHAKRIFIKNLPRLQAVTNEFQFEQLTDEQLTEVIERLKQSAQ